MICFVLQSLGFIGGAYFVGALPSGYWFARMRGINDIRAFGSGNPGATNVGRALGPISFGIVLFADCAKAFAYLILLQALACNAYVMMGAVIALMVGNLHSIFLRGSGGKGVATFMGILLALYPLSALYAFITWVLAWCVVRVVGVASVVAVLAVPWYVVGRVEWFELCVLTSLAFWIVWRHRENIRTYYRV